VPRRGQPKPGHRAYAGLLVYLPYRGEQCVLAAAQLALRKRPVVVAWPVHQHDLDAAGTVARHDAAGRAYEPGTHVGSQHGKRGWVTTSQAAGTCSRARRSVARSRSYRRPVVTASAWSPGSASAIASQVSAATAAS